MAAGRFSLPCASITRPNISSNFLQPLPIDEQKNPRLWVTAAQTSPRPILQYVAADADPPGYLATTNAMLDAKGVARLQMSISDPHRVS